MILGGRKFTVRTNEWPIFEFTIRRFGFFHVFYLAIFGPDGLPDRYWFVDPLTDEKNNEFQAWKYIQFDHGLYIGIFPSCHGLHALEFRNGQITDRRTDASLDVRNVPIPEQG